MEVNGRMKLCSELGTIVCFRFASCWNMPRRVPIPPIGVLSC